MNEPTTDTIEDFKKGKQEAIEAVYHYYKPLLVNFVLTFIKDAEEAEVIFHNVFLKILRRKKELNSAQAIRPYVFTITKNEVRDYFKRLSLSRKKATEYYEGRIESSVDLKIEEEALLNKLEEAMEMLTEQRKKVIQLSYFDNLSYQEIADRMLISKNTVKNHLIKARLSLRSYLT